MHAIFSMLTCCSSVARCRRQRLVLDLSMLRYAAVQSWQCLIDLRRCILICEQPPQHGKLLLPWLPAAARTPWNNGGPVVDWRGILPAWHALLHLLLHGGLGQADACCC